MRSAADKYRYRDLIDRIEDLEERVEALEAPRELSDTTLRN